MAVLVFLNAYSFFFYCKVFLDTPTPRNSPACTHRFAGWSLERGDGVGEAIVIAVSRPEVNAMALLLPRGVVDSQRAFLEHRGQYTHNSKETTVVQERQNGNLGIRRKDTEQTF